MFAYRHGGHGLVPTGDGTHEPGGIRVVPDIDLVDRDACPFEPKSQGSTERTSWPPEEVKDRDISPDAVIRRGRCIGIAIGCHTLPTPLQTVLFRRTVIT